MDFLITGLPRSRTAWFAALMTVQGSPCCHEIGLYGGGIKEARDLGFCGISDPNACLFDRSYLSLAFSLKPVLLIKRDILSSSKSLSSWAGVGSNLDFTEFSDGIDWIEKNLNPMIVNFNDLDDESTVCRAVRYLNNSEVNHATWSLFNLLKIEQHLDKAKEIILKNVG